MLRSVLTPRAACEESIQEIRKEAQDASRDGFFHLSKSSRAVWYTAYSEEAPVTGSGTALDTDDMPHGNIGVSRYQKKALWANVSCRVVAVVSSQLSSSSEKEHRTRAGLSYTTVCFFKYRMEASKTNAKRLNLTQHCYLYSRWLLAVCWPPTTDFQATALHVQTQCLSKSSKNPTSYPKTHTHGLMCVHDRSPPMAQYLIYKKS